MLRRNRTRAAVIDRHDVDAVLGALFDIRATLQTIRELLEDANGEEDEDDS